MAFFQTPPELGNQYDDDRVLRSYIARSISGDARPVIEDELREMGEIARRFYPMQLEDRLNVPVLTQWDAWGKRVDKIEVTSVWKEAAKIAATHGVVATAYEKKHGAMSRIHQFALVYLFDASTDVYTCPLAMTDGAAKTISSHDHALVKERALPRLLSRDPATAWTSGQWMTERTGGSDVGLTETIARPESDGRFRLYGTKWFTSASTSQMALTLGRPEGNPPGGRGLALFYVEVDNVDGTRNNILVNRLKDKLGTKKVPTAELTLDGALAIPIAGTSDGIRAITPMLNVTRTWNAVAAAGAMRRAIALARDYANKRVQFGDRISQKPLHIDTLADIQCEFEAAFQLAFRAVELLGKEENGLLDESEQRLLRLVTPLAKLTTAKQCVAVISEAIECCGGAGYIEDTGLPRLLRDAQVLPIWEGTTNVLSLDSLRAIAKDRSTTDLRAEIGRLAETAKDERLVRAGRQAIDAAAKAERWLGATYASDPSSAEAGARRFALTLGRSFELALLVRHAQWSLDNESDPRPLAAAVRFAAHGVDLLRDEDAALAKMLATDALS